MICKKQFIIKKPQIIRLIKIFSESFQAEKKKRILLLLQNKCFKLIFQILLMFNTKQSLKATECK